MLGNENEGLLAYFSEVAAATIAGKIEWKRVNPTTFTWDTASPAARVNFQRVNVVSASGAQKVYLFQVFNMSQPAISVLAVRTDENPELAEKLAELYELVASSVSQRSLDFMKQMLPK
jgi:hypothetical protein